MGECEFFDPGEQVRYNEQATFRYSVDGQQASALVDLTGLTVTITHRPRRTALTRPSPAPSWPRGANVVANRFQAGVDEFRQR
jgi:hypothetical protein